MTPEERQETILDTIDELADDLVSLLAAREEPGEPTSALYGDHPLWNLESDTVLDVESWLRQEIEDRRKQWGLDPGQH